MYLIRFLLVSVLEQLVMIDSHQNRFSCWGLVSMQNTLPFMYAMH